MTPIRMYTIMAKKKTTTKPQASPLANEIKAAIAKAEQQSGQERQRLEGQMASLQKQRADIDSKLEAVRAQIDGLHGGIAGALAEAAKSAGITIGTGARGAKKKRGKKAGKRRSGKSAAQERELLIAHLKKSKGKVTGEALRKATGVTRSVSTLLAGVKGLKSSGEKRGKAYWLAAK